MPTFRKKPVVIEAVQFDGERLPTGVKRCTETGAAYVVTIHGSRCNVVAGDWIIPEPDGKHFYPCKAEIFANTYEPADAGQILALEFPRLLQESDRVYCPIPDGDLLKHLAVDNDLRDEDLDYIMNHVATAHGFVRPLIREIKRRRAGERDPASGDFVKHLAMARRHRVAAAHDTNSVVSQPRREVSADNATTTALNDDARRTAYLMIEHKDRTGAWLEAALLRTLLAAADRNANSVASPTEADLKLRMVPGDRLSTDLTEERIAEWSGGRPSNPATSDGVYMAIEIQRLRAGKTISASLIRSVVRGISEEEIPRWYNSYHVSADEAADAIAVRAAADLASK